MFYIDTSVLAAYYYPEPISDSVEKFILKIKRPAISALTEVELASSLSIKVREKSISKNAANQILSKFQSHLASGFFNRLAVVNVHYQTAKSWISQFVTPLRTLDALHLAITSTNNLTLLTADQQLAGAAEHFGIKVHTF
jgi:predicted nucleic acid-binding protein